MTQSNADIVKTIIAPVVGHVLPQGEDIRYDPDFEKIEAEITKLTSLHKNQQTDWKLVQKLSYQLLINRSKDLRLACWYSAALLKSEGYVQLVNVFELLGELFNHYGHCGFPLKPRARLAALNWLFDRIDFNHDDFFEKQSDEKLEQLINALMACDAELNKQFGEDAPFLVSKIQQLRDIQRRQQQDKPPELALTAMPAVPTGNPLAVMAPAVSAITEDSDSVRIARYLQEQSRLLIPYLLQKDLADPRAYLLTRSCAWLQISAAPAANEQKITSLKPLTANKLQEYQQRLAAKEFAALIPDLEMSLSKAPFWFDGHYWCAQALQALGHSAMAEYVRHYLSSFLLKFPELVALRFDDGSPFMDAETEAWLFASTTEQQSMVDRPDDINDYSSERPWNSALKTAQENVRQNRKLLKQELRGLQILANAAGSTRETVCWQLALVKLAQQYQRHDLATLILEDIYQLVCQFQLKEWDPRLFKEILQLWQCSLEKINSKQHPDKINEIKNNLYRLDISMAF
ncbi:type VI secretion system protein TssA [uncultured Tolumonas sp.]|uniref:type VI secretion system protein TssA n=1 Tax=uncultured Tolumonas sp. TaxID=263765 RepID=UPI002A0A5270|nr:type VI secretion system protein TssA [uncultured Tolumonas sp.]